MPSMQCSLRVQCQNDAVDADDARQLRAMDPRVLGDRIRSARVGAGLTQSQMAGDDASIAYVSRVEAGARRPSPKLLEAFARRLGTSASHLIVGVSRSEVDEVRLALAFVELAVESGDAATALSQSSTILKKVHSVTAPDLQDRAGLAHARALEGVGRIGEAIGVLETLIATTKTGLAWARSCIALSRCCREAGEFARAIEVGETARSRLEELGLAGSDEAVQLTVTVAAAEYERGDVDRAARMCREAVETAETTGSAKARASAYWNASMMEAHRGAVGAAVPMAERALALLSEGEDRRNMARLRCLLGILQLRTDPPDVDAADSNLAQAETELRETSASSIDLARNTVARARVELLRGSFSDAIALAHEAHEAASVVAPLVAADAQSVEGQALAREGDLDGALRCFRAAVLTLSAIGADRTAGQQWLELGELLAAHGDPAAAVDAFRRAAASTGLRVQLGGEVNLHARRTP